jgi:hypothetical protein
MRRFAKGLTTEHHPLYGIWCQQLSACIFEWDKDDLDKLKAAKAAELRAASGHHPSVQEVQRSLTTQEVARHCRRTTRSAAQIEANISALLENMKHAKDSLGMRLINPETMPLVWEQQKKHIQCLTDPDDVEPYTLKGTITKGGITLDVIRSARGSSSLESFHRHQCAFIPGELIFLCNLPHYGKGGIVYKAIVLFLLPVKTVSCLTEIPVSGNH